MNSTREKKVTLSGGEYVRVLRALYGYRKSPQLWQRHFTKVIERIGGVRCQSEPTMFRDRARDLVILVHVDDILMSGPVSEVESFSKQLKAEVNVRVVGDLVKQGDTVKYIGRQVKRVENGFEIMANVGLIDVLAEEMGVQD